MQTLLETQIVFSTFLRRLNLIRLTYCDDGHCDGDDNNCNCGDDDAPLLSNISTIQIFISRRTLFRMVVIQ